MKYSLQPLLWTHDPNEHGHLPIYFRITIDRKTSYLSTGKFIHENYWDAEKKKVKDAHPDANSLNTVIKSKYNEIDTKILQVLTSGQKITARQVKEMFSGIDLTNFFDFTEKWTKEMQHKRKGRTLENFRKHLLRLELFHGNRQLHFEQIDHNYLVKYEDHLRQTVGSNYSLTLMTTIRTVFNAARKRGVTKEYPFATYEMPIYTPPDKDYLTLSELKEWESFADSAKDPILKQSAIYFLLGCYTGLRISDWFLFSLKKNVRDDRIFLRAKKNGEWVTMPISKPLKRNLVRMAKHPLTTAEQVLNRSMKRIAKKCGISKRLTTHCGRHTFAITICAERGISCETCAELMGITVKTCAENYYKVTNKKIVDEATRAWKGL